MTHTATRTRLLAQLALAGAAAFVGLTAAGTAADAGPACGDEPNLVFAKPGVATYGTSGNDTIHGLGGDDEVLSGTGSDAVYGGSGHDDISTGSGVDHVDGGSGDDFIMGGTEKDYLNGGAGDDTIRGEESNDYLNRYEGVDWLEGQFGDDTLYSKEVTPSYDDVDVDNFDYAVTSKNAEDTFH